VLYVEIPRPYEGVDAWPPRPLHGLPGPDDVLLVDAGETGDPGSLDLGSDAGDGLEVSLTGNGKARLYNVNLQAGELAGYLYFLLHGQGDAWRLLAVAEGGVEDLYSTHVSLILSRSETKLELRLRVIGGRGSPARDRDG
jgi:hypothetical protein